LRNPQTPFNLAYCSLPTFILLSWSLWGGDCKVKVLCSIGWSWTHFVFEVGFKLANLCSPWLCFLSARTPSWNPFYEINIHIQCKSLLWHISPRALYYILLFVLFFIPLFCCGFYRPKALCVMYFLSSKSFQFF
jgi:hypothetical protein